MKPSHLTSDNLTTAELQPVLRRYRQQWRSQVWRWGAIAIAIGLSGVMVGLFDLNRLLAGIPATIALLRDMMPPDFSRLAQWWVPLVDTVAMSVAGTAIAFALAFPLALLAARNTTPHPLCFHLARAVLNLTRAIPELILGMVIVAAVGFGKLPGTLALGLHSVGMVGKFFAEAIELTDPAPIEAARSVGASDAQVIAHGLLPQVWPQVANVMFYRWEYNFRAAMVLGAVGAGGIGLEIIGALRILQYRQVAALLILVFIMVTIVDSLSSYLRQRLGQSR